MSNLVPTSLVISTKVMDEVNASQSLGLKIPEDAVTTGAGTAAKHTWVELLQIVGSTVKMDENKPDVMVFEIKTRIPNDSQFPTNAGRQPIFWYRVNTAALAEGNQSEGQYKMSIISIGKLKAIARATGFPLPEGSDVDILPYFNSTSAADTAPIVGLKVYARFVDKPGKDKDDNPIRRQEPVKFVAEAEQSDI